MHWNDPNIYSYWLINVYVPLENLSLLWRHPIKEHLFRLCTVWLGFSFFRSSPRTHMAWSSYLLFFRDWIFFFHFGMSRSAFDNPTFRLQHLRSDIELHVKCLLNRPIEQGFFFQEQCESETSLLKSHPCRSSFRSMYGISQASVNPRYQSVVGPMLGNALSCGNTSMLACWHWPNIGIVDKMRDNNWHHLKLTLNFQTWNMRNSPEMGRSVRPNTVSSGVPA